MEEEAVGDEENEEEEEEENGEEHDEEQYNTEIDELGNEVEQVQIFAHKIIAQSKIAVSFAVCFSTYKCIL